MQEALHAVQGGGDLLRGTPRHVPRPRPCFSRTAQPRRPQPLAPSPSPCFQLAASCPGCRAGRHVLLAAELLRMLSLWHADYVPQLAARRSVPLM